MSPLSFRFFWASALPLLLLLSACSSTEKADLKRGKREIQHFFPYNVHARRPPYLGADPKVGPGGPDYIAAPAPDARYDCVPFNELFQNLSREKLRQCLLAIPSANSIQYRLVRDPAPRLVLKETPATPSCIKQELPEIPVPREIFFQSNEEGFLSCYASRLDLEADEVLWVKVPKAVTVLNLIPPDARHFETDESMNLLFMSWSLTPFWNTKGILAAKIVADSICKRCMGEAALLNQHAPLPELWP